MQAAKYTGEASVRAVWDSYDPAHPNGVTVASLYRLATQGGWAGNAVTSIDPVGAIDTVPGDTANAKIFAREMAGKIVFNTSRKQWLVFDGGVWLLCERGEVMAAAIKVAGKLLQAMQTYKQRADHNEERAKKWWANAIRLQGQRGLEAMIELSKSVEGMSQPQQAFDSDPWLLCARNGVVDLKSGLVLKHDPNLFLSRQVAADYHADATCPKFEGFLLEAFNGDAETIRSIQRFLGYALTGLVSEEKFVLALGAGANGKSVFANILADVMGTYCMTAPASMLEIQSNSGGARGDLARLVGARLVLANETNEGKAWDSQVIKQLVSTERISTRFLYGEFFEYQPTAKVIVRGNHKPTVHDSGDGMWRRLDLWPFERQFAEHERDPQLLEKLLEERDGILNWMVKGCLQWQRSGLMQSAKIRNASLSYRLESDVVGQWLDECCVLAPGLATDTAVIYANYSRWCEGCGLRPLSKQAFGRRLSARAITSATSNGARKYLGLELIRSRP